MTLRLCDGERLGAPCRALFAVGLARCPHCKSPEHHEFGTRPEDEEHPMSPKISRAGGASVAAGPAAAGAGAGVSQAEQPHPPAPPATPGLDEPERPAVNARKETHLAYAEEVYGLDPELADETFNKRQLLAVIDRLESGEVTVVEGEIVEPAGPESDATTDDGPAGVGADESYVDDSYTSEPV